MHEEYRLSKEQHEACFREILEDYAGNVEPSARLKAVILAGQPGAGKSRLRSDARKELYAIGRGVVEVDMDDLRLYHPEYRRLSGEHPREAANMVQHDAGQWATELVRHAMESRKLMIIDGTLKTPENAVDMCSDLREAGFATSVKVMAVGQDLSKQGIYGRFGAALESGDAIPRWVPEKFHDKAYEGMLESLDVLQKGGLVDSIAVFGRDLQTGARRKLGAWHAANGGAGGPSMREIVQNERSRPLTRLEYDAYERRCREICQAIRKRDWRLKEPENGRAFELADEARARRRAGWQGRAVAGGLSAHA